MMRIPILVLLLTTKNSVCLVIGGTKQQQFRPLQHDFNKLATQYCLLQKQLSTTKTQYLLWQILFDIFIRGTTSLLNIGYYYVAIVRSQKYC